MSNHNNHDMYYDNSGSQRSPGSHRQQQPHGLHRQTSRQFDAYGQMPAPGYGQDDHNGRYDTNRYDRLNNPMVGSNQYAYDMAGSQTWNPSGFGGHHTIGGLGNTGRMKPSRGRSALPTVSSGNSLLTPMKADPSYRLGLTNRHKYSLCSTSGALGVDISEDHPPCVETHHIRILTKS
jgi:hypothetical protein